MRPLLITLVGACASVGTSLCVWALVALDQRPYYEALQGTLLRTTADGHSLQTAIERVLELSRTFEGSPEASLAACDYRERAEAWFTEPDFFGQVSERASRSAYEQTDRTGRRLRLEVLRGEDMAALVFIHHEDRESATRIVAHLANELESVGVGRR